MCPIEESTSTFFIHHLDEFSDRNICEIKLIQKIEKKLKLESNFKDNNNIFANLRLKRCQVQFRQMLRD